MKLNDLWKTRRKAIILAGLGVVLLLWAGTALFGDDGNKNRSSDQGYILTGETIINAATGQTEAQNPETEISQLPAPEAGDPDAGADYFVDYRLERERVREDTKDMLNPLLNSEVEKTRQDAEQQWLAMNTKNQQEDEIESMLKLRGFADSAVNVQKDSVTVVVMADKLSQDDVKVIQDTVTRVCPIRLDKIIITARTK